MRKILFSVLILTTFMSCDKKESSDLKYVETIAGGCALEKSTSLKNGLINQPDTLTYSLTSDSLNIFVGFNSTCCSKFGTSSIIKGDSILIRIQTTQIGTCNCICYYTYNFKFSGSADSYKYHVSMDDYLNFTGLIER
jgi:hypothetical protein